jgi:hypothetical protein
MGETMIAMKTRTKNKTVAWAMRLAEQQHGQQHMKLASGMWSHKKKDQGCGVIKRKREYKGNIVSFLESIFFITC